MDVKKAYLTGDIPVAILKDCVTSLERACFPNQIKLAEVAPLLKKEDQLSK